MIKSKGEINQRKRKIGEGVDEKPSEMKLVRDDVNSSKAVRENGREGSE